MEGVPEQRRCLQGSSYEQGFVKDDEAQGNTDKKALRKAAM